MKKTIGHLLVAFASLFTLIAFCACSRLDKAVEQACEDGNITQAEKQNLDLLFEENNITTPSGKWQKITEICTDYGYDVPLVNPWDKPSPTTNRSILVNVYLDNTSSMAGYVQADDITNFVNVFSGIDALYMDNQVEINAYLTQQETPKGKTDIIRQDWETLKSDLTHKQTKFTDSYQLNDFFKAITDKMIADTTHRIINYFITDGIPSGTNREVTGKRFNINSASVLQTRITKAISACSADEYAVSIYQFIANFKGCYFKYDNAKKIIDNQSRPFYVIAIGEKTLVEQIAKRADEGIVKFFEPQHSVHYGFATGTLTPSLNVNSEYDDSTGTFEVALDNENEKKIAISFPVAQLPLYAREKDYLEANLSITVNGRKTDFTVNKKEIIATARFDRYASYEVSFELKDELPAWVKNYTSQDDSFIEKELAKTFNLHIVTEGLKCGITKNMTNILIDKKFIINYDYQE